MDILLPYVNGDDPEWRKVFIDFKHIPARTPRAVEAMFAPFKRRYSDHGFFKYWWRALEANYGSLTRVHLLLMQESQYPSFLRRDDPRIVPHYHADFIPDKFRPCFNSSTIELCAMEHLSLSSRYILANDDMYFNTPVDDTVFEQDGYPLTYVQTRDAYGAFNTFRRTLTNGHNLLLKKYGVLPFYEWHHIFQVYDDSFAKDLLRELWPDLLKGMSHARADRNHNHMLVMMAQNYEGVSRHYEDFPRDGYFEMPNLTMSDMDRIASHRCICLNDSDGRSVSVARAYLENRYPSKCSFEI